MNEKCKLECNLCEYSRSKLGMRLVLPLVEQQGVCSRILGKKESEPLFQ
jgi:hypothetical protein